MCKNINKDRHFPFGGSPVKTAVEAATRPAFSRDLDLSPEASGSKPSCVHALRAGLDPRMRPCPRLADSLATEATGRHEEGEWGWIYLYKPVCLSCSLPTPYIPRYTVYCTMLRSVRSTTLGLITKIRR